MEFLENSIETDQTALSVSMLFDNRTTKHLNCISAWQELARVEEHQKTIT